jgi:hypothetical protein
MAVSPGSARRGTKLRKTVSCSGRSRVVRFALASALAPAESNFRETAEQAAGVTQSRPET